MKHNPLAAVVTSPVWVFGVIVINREARKADVRYIPWILDSATNSDMVSSTARFAVDMISYSGIAGAPSPNVLADLFDCP